MAVARRSIKSAARLAMVVLATGVGLAGLVAAGGWIVAGDVDRAADAFDELRVMADSVSEAVDDYVLPDDDGSATIGDLAVIVRSWARVEPIAGDVRICGEPTLTNRGSTARPYALDDWRYRFDVDDVNGVVAAGPGSTLEGVLQPGGSATGRICFPLPQRRLSLDGVLWQPAGGETRVVWLSPLG